MQQVQHQLIENREEECSQTEQSRQLEIESAVFETDLDKVAIDLAEPTLEVQSMPVGQSTDRVSMGTLAAEQDAAR